MSAKEPITALLRAWQDGDETALSKLSSRVYDELHRIAQGVFRGERAGHTLQPTALVNEAFINLMDADVSWQDSAHFYALSARMMRRILVSHARSRNAQKRGGPNIAITLQEELVGASEPDSRLEELDDAITRLEGVDARKAELVELQIFGGLSFAEMAEVTGLSSSTIDRELRTAKAWLRTEIAESG